MNATIPAEFTKAIGLGWMQAVSEALPKLKQKMWPTVEMVELSLPRIRNRLKSIKINQRAQIVHQLVSRTFKKIVDYFSGGT